MYDDTGKPDVVELNDLRMWVIKRFDRSAIRLRDLNHLPFKNYTGLDFYPPTEKFKLEAEFHSFPEPKKVEVCPLPPPQNQLKTSILAGEKKYPDSLH